MSDPRQERGQQKSRPELGKDDSRRCTLSATASLAASPSSPARVRRSAQRIRVRSVERAQAVFRRRSPAEQRLNCQQRSVVIASCQTGAYGFRRAIFQEYAGVVSVHGVSDGGLDADAGRAAGDKQMLGADAFEDIFELSRRYCEPMFQI